MSTSVDPKTFSAQQRLIYEKLTGMNQIAAEELQQIRTARFRQEMLKLTFRLAVACISMAALGAAIAFTLPRIF